jgi:hypothetical protein
VLLCNSHEGFKRLNNARKLQNSGQWPPFGTKNSSIS